MGYGQNSKGYKLYSPNKGKMVISRDVKFDEEGAWDWKVDDGEKYDFLPILDEGQERYEDHQEQVTPPQSPVMSSSPLFSSSSESSSSGNPSSPPKRMRSLEALYDVTTLIDDDVTLYCHLATCDPIVFKEVIKDAKWKVVMDKEIASIKKNDIWKLVLRPSGKKPIGVK